MFPASRGRIANLTQVGLFAGYLSLAGALITQKMAFAEDPPQAVNEERKPPVVDELPKLLQLVNQLSERILALEAQVNSMNDKFELHRNSAQSGNPKTSPVFSHPADNLEETVEPRQAASDPEAGFSNDLAVQSFRKATILFQGQKFSEAILAYSGFLEKFPDHALAGSAQYYVGKSYMKQKEYRLALQEFQRVLTSYDRSTHVSDTLNEMAIAEENLKHTADAQKHRQLLSSLFAQAPIETLNSPRATENAEKSDTAEKAADATSPSPQVPLTAPLNTRENHKESPSQQDSTTTDPAPSDSTKVRL